VTVELVRAAGQVGDVIARAARATGVDFEFLLRTARRESSFNPFAQARTSSATGLFQFLDATWLATVKRHGAKHGLAQEAALIQSDGAGRYTVADPSQRRRILDLRFDAETSARLAAEFTRDNAAFVQSRIGRAPDAGELYAAHFLGAGGAAELIRTAETTPWVRADALFPEAARANRPVFYRPDGSARTALELLGELRRTAGEAGSPVGAEPSTSPTSPASLLTAQMYGAADTLEDQAVAAALAVVLSSDGPSLADILAPRSDRGGGS
jgi:hypothetical protein